MDFIAISRKVIETSRSAAEEATMNVLFGLVFALLTGGSAQALSVEAIPQGVVCDYDGSFCTTRALSLTYSFEPSGEERIRQICPNYEQIRFLGFTNALNPTDQIRCLRVKVKSDATKVAKLKLKFPKGYLIDEGGMNCVRIFSGTVLQPLVEGKLRGQWIQAGKVYEVLRLSPHNPVVGSFSGCSADTDGEMALATIWVVLNHLEDYRTVHGVYPPAPESGIVVNGLCLDNTGFGVDCDWNNPSAYSLGLPNHERPVVYHNDTAGCRLVTEIINPLPQHGLFDPGPVEFSCDFLKQSYCSE